MIVDELTERIKSFLRFLAKRLQDEGFPLEGAADTGLRVRGHDVTLLFAKYMTGKGFGRFEQLDYTIVNDFLDDNWARLQTPYTVPIIPDKVKRNINSPDGLPIITWNVIA